MGDFDYVACEIAKYEALIEELYLKIEHMLRRIEELRYSAVLNEEGEITSYADWAA